MQYHPQGGYPGTYPQQSSAFNSSQYHDNRSSYGYAAQNSTPQAQSSQGAYGAYSGTPAYPTSQGGTYSSYGSTDRSYSDSRASKRPRLDGVPDDDTPSKSTGSWVPMTGGPSQYVGEQQREGLALPPMPLPPRPVDNYSQQSAPDSRSGGHQRSQSNAISSILENQVRGLAGYNPTNDVHQQNPTATPQQLSQGYQGTPSQQTGSSPFQMLQPERGAKEGQVLNLSCVMCMKKKRKCSKTFPCNECQKFGDECVVSKRKMRTSTVKNKEKEKETEKETDQADAPAEEESEPEHDALEGTEQRNGVTHPGKRVIRDHNDPNRKYLLNLPRVVDGYQQWTNMSLPYHPFPENLDEIREKLFKLEKPILLNSQQYADYWPHISNVYARGVGPWWDPSNGVQMETWECRNQRRQSRHQRVKGPGGAGIRKRARKLNLLEGTEMCRLRFRIHAFIKHANDGSEDHKKGLGNCNCVPEWLFMERMRASTDVDHNHTLDSLDKYKRTDALLFFAENKVIEGGYLYAAVRRWIVDNYSHKTKEVEYLTDHDVANAARRWRVQNRELELLDTIPDPNPDDERGEKCLKLIPTAKLDGLQQALKEICKQLPEATKIALPILEASQNADVRPAENNARILEGDDIVIPVPGVPGHRLNTLYKVKTPPPRPAEPAEKTPKTAQGSAAQQSGQKQGKPLPPPSLPVHSQMPPLGAMPPPPPRFQVYQPQTQAPAASNGPIMGNYSIISGSHRVQIPAAGSKMAASVADSRPSWAKPGAQPPPLLSHGHPAKDKAMLEKQNKENEEQRVQKQLEAELQV